MCNNGDDTCGGTEIRNSCVECKWYGNGCRFGKGPDSSSDTVLRQDISIMPVIPFPVIIAPGADGRRIVEEVDKLLKKFKEEVAAVITAMTKK